MKFQRLQSDEDVGEIETEDDGGIVLLEDDIVEGGEENGSSPPMTKPNRRSIWSCLKRNKGKVLDELRSARAKQNPVQNILGSHWLICYCLFQPLLFCSCYVIPVAKYNIFISITISIFRRGTVS